jgi:hypothetical protein
LTKIYLAKSEEPADKSFHTKYKLRHLNHKIKGKGEREGGERETQTQKKTKSKE